MESITDRVDSLRPVRFRWRKNMGHSMMEGKDDYGLVAQEVQQVFPELVETTKPVFGGEK